ncbi:30S ribosomal protein S20 [subsurface metagenome]|jgi:small subunit ribosomal protein S20|uniref:30S ribosomal protein S20 n=3 Tax=marine sediment metagenome TaxID=412755 RepID=X1AFI6_9ZZZZ|nr:30S ribosomal protein S20 [Clostridia bacterium]TET13967.1 MAG: 30S ribosomal protein S20 [Actinomycetota bacterium]
MPNIKSQKKRDRQNIKIRTGNKLLKTRIKTDQKRLAEVVNSKNIEEAEKNFNILSKHLDKAVKKGAVHKNFSANKKSKAAKLVNSIRKS